MPRYTAIALFKDSSDLGLAPKFCGHAHRTRELAEPCRTTWLIDYPATLRREDVLIIEGDFGTVKGVREHLKDDVIEYDEIQEDP